MARIGMIHPVYAPITSHTDGSAITYGTGAVVCHAISATLTQNRRDNPLYGDDVKVENDKGLTDYTLEFEGDKLTPDMRVALLGDEKITGSTNEYSVTDENAPEVGFGYVRKLLENNVVKYEAIWFHKIQFAVTSESDNTKGDQINWGTATINGSGMGVNIDNTGKVRFYAYMQSETLANAVSWLHAKANIT